MAHAPDHFRHFAVVDWSGAVGERQIGIAVALCAEGDDAPKLVRPGHRWSRAEVLSWLLDELPPSTLVGLDLSPGLPHADAGTYFPDWPDAPYDAKTLWETVDALCASDRHLSAIGFLAHPEVHRHYRHRKEDVGDLFVPGAGRMRVCELRQKAMKLSPSSCMNLIGSSQVGKSSLTGMRVLHRLHGHIPVWPFDPIPENGPLIVEIYTSIAARDAGIRQGFSKIRDAVTLDVALSELGSRPHDPMARYDDHATDAILTAAWLRSVADRDELWHPPALTPEIARTEGWTFGVA